MFNKEDMMVSVLVAEKIIKEKEEKFDESLKEVVNLLNNTVNTMKHNAMTKGFLTIFNSRFSFGEPTPYLSNGIQLFTGDEVEFKSGKKGVVVNIKEGYYIYTNAERAVLVDRVYMESIRSLFRGFEGYETGDNLKITKHFNELTLGEEIAKGRKGASGFIVEQLWREGKEV